MVCILSVIVQLKDSRMQILLTVAYDGTNYAGWQRQQNAIAVQQKLEEALSAVFNRPITTKAASRTDAGVHALGQQAAFFADDIRIPIGKLPQILSGRLPADISVTAARPVSDSFNPRFDAVYKTYSYSMYCAPCPNPLLGRYSAFIPQPVDIETMKKSAGLFIGRHDFTAFMATGSSAKTTVREIYACAVTKQPSGLVTLTITGSGFLYNMVRIIAGTVLYTGLGKIVPEAVLDIIHSHDRKKAGKTMPPEGLILLEVGYTKYRILE